MRITSLICAVSLTLATTGAAFAQGAPGGNGSGGNVTGGSTTSSSASEPGNAPGNGKAATGAGGATTDKSGSGTMMKNDGTSKEGGSMQRR